MEANYCLYKFIKMRGKPIPPRRHAARTGPATGIRFGNELK
jgi:hypothetical protein